MAACRAKALFYNVLGLLGCHRCSGGGEAPQRAVQASALAANY
jgi:hypothetical protein